MPLGLRVFQSIWQKYFLVKRNWVQKHIDQLIYLHCQWTWHCQRYFAVETFWRFFPLKKMLFIWKTFIWWCDTRLSNSSSRCDNCSLHSQLKSLTSSVTFPHDHKLSFVALLKLIETYNIQRSSINDVTNICLYSHSYFLKVLFLP